MSGPEITFAVGEDERRAAGTRPAHPVSAATRGAHTVDALRRDASRSGAA